MNKEDGGLAFPCEQHETQSKEKAEQIGVGALSLRDYFAAKAMQGILTGPCSRDGVPIREWFDVPETAYKLADAMIEAMKAPPSPDNPDDHAIGG